MQGNIEDPIPISELVAMVGVSSRSLERKFRTYLNTTPNTYYRQLRLAQANNLLLNTTLSVREVGLACGFSEGFSVLYKKFFGITPLEMRHRRKSGR
jgi:transcriptional regulator GlxA family with amidase domain